MNTVTKTLAAMFLATMMVAIPAVAAGPVEGEVSALWWANDFDSQTTTTNVSSDAGAPGLRAELWLLDRYGVKASQYGSDPDETDGADYTSIDFMWRALAPTENNFVAVGLGWEQMEIDSLGEDTSGMRVSVEGSVGIVGMLQAYGQGAYLPSLDDVSSKNALVGSLHDLDAYEYEIGMAWNAMPFMNVHAGYRVSSLSYSQDEFEVASVPVIDPIVPSTPPGGMQQVGQGAPADCEGCSPAATFSGGNGETESSGFFVGLGFKF